MRHPSACTWHVDEPSACRAEFPERLTACPAHVAVQISAGFEPLEAAVATLTWATGDELNPENPLMPFAVEFLLEAAKAVAT